MELETLAGPPAWNPRFYSTSMVRTFGYLHQRLIRPQVRDTTGPSGLAGGFDPAIVGSSLVIVGSGANDNTASDLMSMLRQEYDLQYSFRRNNATNTIDLVGSSVQPALRPSFDNEHLVDFALIVRAIVGGTTDTLMIAGCSVIGTEGAAAALVSPYWVANNLSEYSLGSPNIALVVKITGSPAVGSKDQPLAERVELLEYAVLTEIVKPGDEIRHHCD